VVAELVVVALERRPGGIRAEQQQRRALHERLEPPRVGALPLAERLPETVATILAGRGPKTSHCALRPAPGDRTAGRSHFHAACPARVHRHQVPPARSVTRDEPGMSRDLITARACAESRGRESLPLFGGLPREDRRTQPLRG